MRKPEFFVIRQVLLALYLIYVAESQLLNITSQPTSPVSVLEGQPLRLEWKFSVQRTFRRVQVSISGEALPFLEKSFTSMFLRGRFTGRLTASTTETNATITFFSVNRTDSNDYVFVVLDTSGGSVQVPFQVVVQYPPLLQRTTDQVVQEGGPAINLTCTADGEPAPNITWTKVFANGRDSDVLSTGELFILPNRRTNNGTYRCKASNGIGSDVNHTVNVLVNYIPEGVQLHVTEETVCNGAQVTFNCSAVDANPMELTYYLYENNVMVSDSSSTGIWNRTMTTRGEHVYRCGVTNIIGTVMSRTVSVTVNVSSSIKSIPENVVTEGNDVTLICNASGFPEPVVSWINVQSGWSIAGNVIMFVNISRQQAGEYRCKASNPCGNAIESGTIDVQFKPEMVQLVASETTVCQGENITFNCSANSNPAVHTYELYVNGTMVSEKSSTGVWNRATTTGGMFVYKCKASNTIGTTMSMDVFVTINALPTQMPFPYAFDDNNFLALWRFDDQADKIHVHLRVKTTGWIGFGFAQSAPNNMRDYDVIVGGFSNGRGYLWDYKTFGQTVPKLDASQDYTLLDASESGSYTQLIFERPRDTKDESDFAFMRGSEAFIVWSYSNVDISDKRNFGIHSSKGWSSKKYVLVAENQPIPTEAKATALDSSFAVALSIALSHLLL